MIIYKVNPEVTAQEVIRVYDASLIKRPTRDLERIDKMIVGSSITIGAYDGEILVGYSRSFTDFSYACYLSDLAVDSDYQKQGIGKKMISILQEKLGEEVSIVLISAPSAVEFYEKIGLEKSDRAFLIPRIR